MARNTFVDRLIRLTRFSGLMLAFSLIALAAAIVRVVAEGPAALLMVAEFATGAMTAVLVLGAIGALIEMNESGNESRSAPTSGGPAVPAWAAAATRAATVAFIFVVAAVDTATAATAGIAFLVLWLGFLIDRDRRRQPHKPGDYVALLVGACDPRLEHCTRIQASSLDAALVRVRRIEPSDGLAAYRLAALCPADDADRVMLDSGETLGERLRRADMEHEDARRIDAAA